MSKASITFYTKPFGKLSEEELQQCADLFSNNYGKYSGLGGKQKGRQIKMPVSLYKRFYEGKDKVFVSLCYADDKLIGQAFFIKAKTADGKVCSWVTQLVVDSHYRKRGYGSKLLNSAWGFSNYFAWGLATANAKTLKTLESATWRQVDVAFIMKNIGTIKEIMKDIPFIRDSNKLLLDERTSQIFSDFYPEIEKDNQNQDLAVYTERLGEIQPGYEWLAFTFSDQQISYSEEKLHDFLSFSEQQLKEAYSRMDMAQAGWTQGTPNEIDFILSKVDLAEEDNILDLGCGQGRHTLAFAERGYQNITGVDFSDSNIRKAKENALDKHLMCSFIKGDARVYQTGTKYKLILCLYDVIGSFRDEKDNRKIIKRIKSLLAKSGTAVISVMNMELTEKIAKNIVSVKQNPNALLQLPPSKTMAVSGNIFNSDFFLINTDDNLVYRKEQFEDDGMLSAEYLVADRRYKMDEIIENLAEEGLEVTCHTYVSAGHWDEPLDAIDSHAKEILLFAKHKGE